jgi:hypothetical protein
MKKSFKKRTKTNKNERKRTKTNKKNSKKRITRKDNKNGGFLSIFKNPNYDTIESKKAKVIEILKYKTKCEEQYKKKNDYDFGFLKNYGGRIIWIPKYRYYFEDILDKMCDFLYYSNILHKSRNIQELIYKIIKIKTQNKKYGTPQYANLEVITNLRRKINFNTWQYKNNELMIPIDNIRTLMHVMIRFIDVHFEYDTENKNKKNDDKDKIKDKIKDEYRNFINEKDKSELMNIGYINLWKDIKKKDVEEKVNNFTGLYLDEPQEKEPVYKFENNGFDKSIKEYSQYLFKWAITSVLNAWFECELCYIDIEKVIGTSKTVQKTISVNNDTKPTEKVLQKASIGFYYNIKDIKDKKGELIQFDSVHTWMKWYFDTLEYFKTLKLKNDYYNSSSIIENEAFTQKLEIKYLEVYIERHFNLKDTNVYHTNNGMDLNFNPYERYHRAYEEYVDNKCPIEDNNIVTIKGNIEGNQI